MGSFLHNAIYKWNWDTRCRNVDVSGLIGPANGEPILDAGCGDRGLAAFMPAANITGMDIPSEGMSPTGKFVFGSILQVPFAGRSFPTVTSIAVLEHLPAGLRPKAIEQLVEAAGKKLVMTFPSGERSRQVDEHFAKEIKSRGGKVPDWLAEHLASPYPEVDAVANAIKEAAAGRGRSAKIDITYSENLAVSKALRRSAVRSKHLYLAMNIAAGFLMPILPKAAADTAYRAIITATFTDEKS